VLVGGAVLAPGKRPVTQALRVMGRADKPGFGRYHEVLNRARWDARYRDAVRSSHGHFVKTSGLRWLSLAVMLPVPFAGRRWARLAKVPPAGLLMNYRGTTLALERWSSSTRRGIHAR
jgi:hypothetical protein